MANLTYQFILQREYNKRFQKNPAYSMRAYCRDIQIAPPKLSAALNGKGGFSPAKAKDIAAKLNIPDHEKVLFVALVASKHARSAALRKAAEKEVELLLRKHNRLTIEFETFQIISEWHHYAILEMTLTKNFKSDPKWIAKRLGVDVEKIKEAIDRLVQVKMIELDENKNIKLLIDEDFSAKPYNPHAPVIQNYHSALRARFEQTRIKIPDDEWTQRGFVFAIPKNKIPELRKKLSEILWEFGKEEQSIEENDSVYALTAYMFPLTLDE